ncbi:hypothetical protein B296_00050205 [Ensete ventricosum]|uniref:Uncharacterized protein n=1 Tax=Ensete ventricosum TaxID=4639 RepID=A0A426XLE6_ENSVE|nr:hypothetical protein B296_00050205 [Ensete ventricosum]
MKEKKTAPRHESAGPSACNHSMAIQDINRALELLSQLHAVLLQLHPSNGGDMLEEIRRFTSTAVSRLQSCVCGSSDASEDSLRDMYGNGMRKSLKTSCVEYRTTHTCKTIDVVLPSVMESAPKEASVHASGFRCTLEPQENHLSPLAHAAIEAQDEGLWISDQAQDCELLGSDMMATEPWDLDMFLEDDDGWYNVQ